MSRVAPKSTAAWMMGKSLVCRAWRARRPMPGQPKINSTTTEPFNRPTKIQPIIVTKGKMATLRACL